MILCTCRHLMDACFFCIYIVNIFKSSFFCHPPKRHRSWSHVRPRVIGLLIYTDRYRVDELKTNKEMSLATINSYSGILINPIFFTCYSIIQSINALESTIAISSGASTPQLSHGYITKLYRPIHA